MGFAKLRKQKLGGTMKSLRIMTKNAWLGTPSVASLMAFSALVMFLIAPLPSPAQVQKYKMETPIPPDIRLATRELTSVTA